MREWGRVKFLGLFLVGLLLVFKLGGCSAANLTPGWAPLPAVTPLPNPQLPDWIEQISPLGEAAPTAQIRIRFKEPLIPVENLESKDQQDLLKKFEILPPLPGQFRFLTPRMVGFQADRATPQATRVKVTLKAGLADLKNHRLDKDLAWTFNTEPIKLTNLPGSAGAASSGEPAEPFETKPVLKITSNTELDLASLREHLKLMPPGETKGVLLRVDLQKQEGSTEDLSAAENFDDSGKSWVYAIEPQQALAKSTRYRLEVVPGVRPAQGNLPSETTFASQIETFSPLAFQKLGYYGQPDAGGAYGRFVKGTAQLEFNNGLNAESAIASISVNPAPRQDVPLVQVYEGDRIINLNPWALEPATTYTITIGSGLKDKFGQTLGKPVTVQYDTGDVSPDIWAPSGLNIFPTGKDLQLNISAVNLPSYKSAFSVVQPTDLVYYDSAYPREGGSGLLPDPSTWRSTPIQTQNNQAMDIPVPLQKELGGSTGMLAYGVQARTNAYKEDNQERWREPTIYGLVQLTNLGVFAQWFPESGIVRVHHLSDGAPVASASVRIYQSRLEATSPGDASPCATGTTGKDGTLLLTAQTLQSCMGGNRFAEPPKLLVIAQEGSDWAFTRTNEYSGAYGYGVEAGWQSSKPESRGTIVSDRQLYQPGETATLTGFAYYLQNGALKQDKKVPYTLTLEGPNGLKKNLGTQTTNDFGTFSLELPLEPNQPLGYHYVKARADNGVEILGEFRVAEFKPPNFKVELTLSGGELARSAEEQRSSSPQAASPPTMIALGGRTIEAKTQSSYLFGAPVEGGKANYYVTRQQTQFKPRGWEEFSFGRQWFWPEEAPVVATDVLQTSQVLNNSGQSSQTVKVEQNLPYPMTYRVDAQVSDVSNLSVSDSKTFVALPGDRLIGLQSDFVATAGKDFPVKVIVTDPSGKPYPSQRVRLELQQMNYSRVTRLVEGSRIEQNQVEYKTVDSKDVQADVQPQTALLKPPTSGSYRIRAMLGGGNEVSATDIQIWATGDSPVGWGNRYRNNRLEITLDKKSYRLGDTATALIQSPYPDAELYFSVVRHNTLYRTVTRVTGGAPQVQFQITPDMIPNAAVEAVLVRQGKPLAQVEPGSLNNLVRIGFAPFATDLSTQYLQVDTQIAPTLKPGDEQTVRLTLRNAQNQPAQGQITVMVVNEAVLQLTGYRPPDLVKTVYAEQPISTRLSDNRPDVVIEPLASPLEKGWGYGGGIAPGAGSTRVRADFKPLAYYNPAVMTDAIGNAEVTFKLPDDLTTWRVMAIATDGNLHFGNGDATFLTTQPLIASPLLPQFARPGDRFQIGTAITNNTGQGGNVSVNGTVTPPLKLDKPGSTQGQVGDSGTTAYRFPVEVQETGTAKVQFNTQLGSATDGFEVPLEIRTQDVIEQVIESGSTTSEAKVPIQVDKDVARDVGGLEITLASTLMPTLTAPAQQVLDQADLPFLEPAASQLAIAANLDLLSKTYGQTFAGFAPKQQASQAIERLQRLRKPDGGFASYPRAERSDPFVTPYAARAIAQATRAAIETQRIAALEAPLKTYLSNLLANPGQYDFCKESLCKNQLRLEALIALAELGDQRSDFLADLYAARSQFDPVEQIKLARYLLRFPNWQQEARAMADQIQETIYETGHTATVNLPLGWSWLNSPTVAQAEALQLEIAQKARPNVIDRSLQGLLAQRRNGTWQSTFDNAEALTALVAYRQLQPVPPDFEATAQLAGKTLTSVKFQGYQNPSSGVKVPIQDLPQNRNDLMLKKTGQGVLHYLVAYRYRLNGNQPGRVNGLRVTRTIRPANQDKVLFRTGLYAPDPLKVPAGQVYDVGLEIITDHPVNHVLITDPLPAGFEAVDNSFQTSTPYFEAKGDSWQLAYQTIYKDRVVAYGDKLDPGVYTLHYLVRSVTPGTFVYPGSEAHLQYAPEEFGRSASSILEVTEK
ncbi:alpha-2-macroglobulin family protein [Leptothermofonsia sichuanensis E412]|uniref:alpha-2-macroglobulin family protein n=1 Tax=Leptothermofonsia sichuanensis TaxID=2917832 RepID=UPI001CA78A0C|nr:alpha-2-macroglobulin [Leptothermofonsia sichuanensis]QZZ20770.1 alpha-2-macroglobulin family protein [Leptothermofonsia sichuanensis E412]